MGAGKKRKGGARRDHSIQRWGNKAKTWSRNKRKKSKRGKNHPQKRNYRLIPGGGGKKGSQHSVGKVTGAPKAKITKSDSSSAKKEGHPREKGMQRGQSCGASGNPHE